MYPGIYRMALELGMALLGMKVLIFHPYPYWKNIENVKMERKCEPYRLGVSYFSYWKNIESVKIERKCELYGLGVSYFSFWETFILGRIKSDLFRKSFYTCATPINTGVQCITKGRLLGSSSYTTFELDNLSQVTSLFLSSVFFSINWSGIIVSTLQICY